MAQVRLALGSVVVALVLTVAARPAEARRGGGGIVVINTGETIIHIRDLPPATAAVIGYRKLGYKHALFGLFWFDFWRWDGEFVVYNDGGSSIEAEAIADLGSDIGSDIPAFSSGTHYVPIDDALLDELGGASTPWRYHFPEGLLIILALIELVVITKTRRPLKVTLAIGGTLLVIALAFFLKGLTWEFMIPAFLGLHHILGSRWALQRQAEQDARAAERAAREAARPAAYDATADDDEVVPRRSRPDLDARLERPSQPPPPAPAARPHVPGPLVEDAARMRRPPRPSQPLVIERPQTAPVEAPIVHDPSVEGPKLLR
ncbi:MAG: hypothetical protein H0T89_22690 [Deltaproteobacteria bacterium]|nr:hypothetical protein [Deltaproteobacteria bacterium]MDQ3296164.1 hypothetical protein [Myxococcota bacterium]